jgi:hypothetical protein
MEVDGQPTVSSSAAAAAAGGSSSLPGPYGVAQSDSHSTKTGSLYPDSSISALQEHIYHTERPTYDVALLEEVVFDLFRFQASAPGSHSALQDGHGLQSPC